MKRLYSLDYVRGLAALAVLVYHLRLWETPKYVPTAESFLDRLGLYGVSLFYILSGFTLARVYQTADWTRIMTWTTFFKRRIFRLLPLLMLVSFLSAALSGRSYPIWKWVLNLTGLFGYVNPGAYIATGAWSIGNELVFYGLFPFLLWLASTRWRSVLLGVWCVAWLIVPWVYLTTNSSLPNQWNDYINPLYQALFFVGGVLISEVTLPNSWVSIGLFGTSLVLLGLYPVVGGHIDLVVGLPKIVLGSACLLLVVSVSSLPALHWEPLHTVFKTLGEWSYGIYLWHPVVFTAVSQWMLSNGGAWGEYKIPLFFGVLFIVSGISYHGFEKPWVRWGK